MTPKPTNPALYERCKNKVKKSYTRWPSAYGSAALVKCYKGEGGEYARGSRRAGAKGRSARPRRRSGKRSHASPVRRGGVAKWMREQWVQVGPYLRTGKVEACGAHTDRAKACRPLRRVDATTPPTLPELLQLHSKGTLLMLARKKTGDMHGRVYWKRGTFVPSDGRPNNA